MSKNHYWIAVDELIGNYSRIEARYDTPKNEVRIDSKEYTLLTVRLNDHMVNLDKPVRIYFNEALVYEGTPQRCLTTMIKTWQEREDPGLVFPVEITIHSQGEDTALAG